MKKVVFGLFVVGCLFAGQSLVASSIRGPNVSVYPGMRPVFNISSSLLLPIPDTFYSGHTIEVDYTAGVDVMALFLQMSMQDYNFNKIIGLILPPYDSCFRTRFGILWPISWNSYRNSLQLEFDYLIGCGYLHCAVLVGVFRGDVTLMLGWGVAIATI